MSMEATLTELQRKAGRVAEAIARGERVRLTRHGETIAEIQPRRRAMTGAEFARAWRNRKPLGKETANEIAAALKQLDKAA